MEKDYFGAFINWCNVSLRRLVLCAMRRSLRLEREFLAALPYAKEQALQEAKMHYERECATIRANAALEAAGAEAAIHRLHASLRVVQAGVPTRAAARLLRDTTVRRGLWRWL